jgi:predicted nucleic acid-binding protein
VTAPVVCVVTDSNVLINLMHVSRLGLLGRIPGHEFVVPDHVREEITEADQRRMLDAAIAAGAVGLERITELEALASFSELIIHIGRGEAACIVLATQHGWSIASDEKRRFRREALARVGESRILGTPELFVMAIRAGLLTLEQADADKRVLEGHRFKMAFASFAERLG